MIIVISHPAVKHENSAFFQGKPRCFYGICLSLGKNMAFPLQKARAFRTIYPYTFFMERTVFMQQIILASNSPRRKELLSMLSVPFTVQESHVDERALEEADRKAGIRRTPAKQAAFMAEAKGTDVSLTAPANSIIIAADTMVARGTPSSTNPRTKPTPKLSSPIFPAKATWFTQAYASFTKTRKAEKRYTPRPSAQKWCSAL